MGNESKSRIVFLCSGGGGNLRFIHHAIKNNWIQNSIIVGVITDRFCDANLFASQQNIYTKQISFAEKKQSTLLDELKLLKPDLIITTVHKILDQEIISNFRDKLINLHYSLLPSFGGLIGTNPIRNAIEYGAKFIGVTTHKVIESVDSGKPIHQAVIPLELIENNFDHIMNIVFRCGCITLLGTTNEVLNSQSTSPHPYTNQLKVIDRICLFNGKVPFIQNLSDEQFWNMIAQKPRELTNATFC